MVFIFNPRSSLGSADSLDRMSSLSSSSKGSNKVLSLEDVEAIVEMQERSKYNLFFSSLYIMIKLFIAINYYQFKCKSVP